MSVGVVTENSAKAALETVLPPRPISGRPNLVTKAGLKMLQDDLARAHEALEEASRIEDIDERRHQSAVPHRDAQYLAERVRTAQVKPAPASNNVVAFGHKVTFERDDGRVQTYRIVGEDEANPAAGTISHGSPVAIALMGKSVGDVVRAGQHELEIIAIE